ncbi:MAG: type II secretion system protein GspN [Desulfobulbus propionicus]|nr:MAG: type II secretion system protein GspN [Desulfobulbus propionicus]
MGKGVSWSARIAGILLYTLFIVGFMLVFFFPSPFLQQWIPAYVAHFYPPFTARLESIDLDFPDKLVIKTLGLGTQQTSGPLVQAEEMVLQPDWVQLAQLSPAVLFSAKMHKGQAAGTIRYEENSFLVEGTLKGLQLSTLNELSEWVGRSVSGTVNGTYQKRLAQGKGQSFTMLFNASDGAIGVKQPILAHTSIPYTVLRCTVTGKNNTVRLAGGHIESPLFTADFDGTVTIQHLLTASTLHIQGKLKPRPEFFSKITDTAILQRIRSAMQNKDISFQITGDVGVPGLDFGTLSPLIQELQTRVKK